LGVAVPVVFVALFTSTFPDRIERWVRADHRGYTHWPLLMGLTALLIALLVPLAAVEVAQAVSHDPAAAGRVGAASGPLAVLVAIGFAIGTICHILGDAATLGGAPLFGPVSRRDFWILPKRLRFRVYKVGLTMTGLPVARQTPSTADTAIRVAATASAVLIALVYARPHSNSPDLSGAVSSLLSRDGWTIAIYAVCGALGALLVVGAVQRR
jgi:hypothetical protein